MTTTNMNYESRLADMNDITNCENRKITTNQLVKVIMDKYGLYIKNWSRMKIETIEKKAAEVLWNDYYGQEKIHATFIIQRRFRNRQQNKPLRDMYNNIIAGTPLETKWRYVRNLRKYINDDRAFKQQRLLTMYNYNFQIKGVTNMTKEQMIDMCVRALFISYKQKNRPKLNGIKWMDRE